MRKKLLIIAFVTLLGNGILGYFVFKSNRNRLISEYWVQHTMQVRYQADKLFAIGNQLQIALKAYNLTGDTSFLKPLYASQNTIFKNIDELSKLTNDNPLEHGRCLSLHMAMQQFLNRLFAQAGISPHPSPAQLEYVANPDDAFNNTIKVLIDNIQKEENDLLQSRIQRNMQDIANFNWLTLVIFSAMAGFTLVLLITIRQIFIQGREKDLRAGELTIANETLDFENDEKIKRADELVIANRELTYQNDEKDKRAAELIIAEKNWFLKIMKRKSVQLSWL